MTLFDGGIEGITIHMRNGQPIQLAMMKQTAAVTLDAASAGRHFRPPVAAIAAQARHLSQPAARARPRLELPNYPRAAAAELAWKKYH